MAASYWACAPPSAFYQQIYLLTQLFYSLSVKSFFENSSSKASRLLIIFVSVNMGPAHFSNDKIRISCEPDRPTSVFFSCKIQLRKPGSKSDPPDFQPRKETRLWEKVTYAYVSVIWALFSLYFSYVGCFHHQLMVCSCGGRKINKYTNIHTHKHTLFGKRFQETRRMPTASCGHVPGLKAI